MTIGVILHISNPSFDDVAAVARAAERAGADWLGLPDAFWWRDTWLLAARAAAETERIEIGPTVTNPYLRHPFHTLSALASLQELAGQRVFLGVGAGGTELSAAAGVDRSHAATRIRDLVGLLRSVTAGNPLDEAGQRHLDVPLQPLPVLVAGRGDGVLRSAGAVADRVLLWALPTSDLERSVGLVRAGAARRGDGGAPEVIWAPLVDHDGSGRARRSIAYAVLNSRPALHEQWGLSPELLARVRQVAVSQGNDAAGDLLPDTLADEFVFSTGDTDRAADWARRMGATGIAVRATSPELVAPAVEWARRTLSATAVVR